LGVPSLGVPSTGPDLIFLAGYPSEFGILSGAGRLGGGIIGLTGILEGLAPLAVKLNLTGGCAAGECAAGAASTTGLGALILRMILGFVRIFWVSLKTNLPYFSQHMYNRIHHTKLALP